MMQFQRNSYEEVQTSDKMHITICGVALDILCLLDFDFPVGIHPFQLGTTSGFPLDLMYAKGEEYPLGNQSLTDKHNKSKATSQFVILYDIVWQYVVIRLKSKTH